MRAQNLIVFLQMAAGIDDDTWLYHLRQGDYARWFREDIKDEQLAQDATRFESQTDLSARDSREQIRALIDQHYTLPGGPATPVTERKAVTAPRS